MAWYKVGTITVTNGSTTVTGSGTAWIANAAIGEALYAPDGRLYEITNIASDTAFTIAPAYLGSTQSGQAYVIVPSQSYIRDLAAQAADLVNNYSTVYNTVGQGKFGDGTLGAPGIRFADDLDTGFYRSASNEVTFVAGGTAIFKYNLTGGLQLSSVNLDGGTIDGTTIGGTTPAAGAFTTLSASSTVSGTGFSNYLASPPAIGGTAAAAGSFTNLSYTGTLTGGTGVINIGSGQIYKDASGNVGIGGSPGSSDKLQITTTAANNLIRFYQNGTAEYWLGMLASTNALVFGAGGGTSTERMRIDSSGNVGIGTSSPSSKLDVVGTLRLTNTVNAANYGLLSDLGGLYIQSLNSNPMYFATGGTERMRIDSSGNVGIGTSSPASKLDITSGSARALFTNQSATFFIGAVNTTNTAHAPLAVNGSELILKTGDAERMRVDSAGNVGIGTGSPSDKLSLYAASGNIFTRIQSASSTYLAGTYSDGTGASGTLAANPYIFLTNNTERMRVDSAGDLLVGTTSQYDANRLTIAVANNGIGITGNNGSTAYTANGTGNYNFGLMRISGTQYGSISVTTGGTAYNTSSDYRLKEQVTPMTGALAKNDLLNPVTYKWKADGSDGQGFIAHELQAVFPDAVTGEKDAVDDEGKPVYQGVDTSFLVGHLVACVKELTAELNNVKAELAILKGN